MKFFNIDLHCSVITDVATNFGQLGHSVDECCMSGHWWALNKPRVCRGTTQAPNGHIGYGPVNLATWESIFWLPVLPDDTMAITETMAKQCPELSAYNGFICCYPPSFAYLYGKLNRPIIVNVPVRYEYPFTAQLEHWKRFNRYLTQGQAEGKVYMVGNSVYECKYYEYFTGQPMQHISSLCSYIDRFAPKWSGMTDVVYAFGEHAGSREAASSVPGVKFIRDTIPQYQHRDISAAKALVWVPYNCSIMSFFEHYWLNMPIFVPSIRFVQELYARKAALSQYSWNYEHTGSLMPRVGTDLPDPNHRDNVAQWLGFYDFYNQDEFPHLIYFDSWAELASLLKTTDYKAVSASIAEQNQKRKERSMAQWASILSTIH